jgi:hypothetical protein
MRASIALLALLCLSAVAFGAVVVERQPRLGADRSLLLPSTPRQPDAAAAGAAADPSQPRHQWWWQEQPAQPWWARLWPWAGGWHRPEPQQRVRIAPVLPDGRGATAPPAELLLPASQLSAEGAGLVAGRNPADPGDNSYFSYNSSAMTPLVPMWLSWMTDAARMSNRSHGLEFEVGAGQDGVG